MESGLPFGGPYKVVTDLGILGFVPTSKQMRLEMLQDGVDLEEVMEKTGFELSVAPRVGKIDPPTESELTIIRAIDPERVMLGN